VYIFLIIHCNLPRYPLRTLKLQEKPSAFEREHPALQKMKLINFFLFLWVIFALMDLDTGCESGSKYRSRDPIESGSTTLLSIHTVVFSV
jgi:hypothetical protein